MNPDSLKVSVIIAVYQGADFVKGAIVSALNQTHANLEILVVDDGSTDETWTVLQSIGSDRVRLFHQENAGASTARNHGLKHATGEYVAFLDADDRWLPTKLEIELATLASGPDPVGIAYSWYYAVDEDGMLLHRSQKIAYSGLVFHELMCGTAFILSSASLFHRRIFDDVGGFDTRRRHHEDFAFVLRACRKYPAFPTRHYSVLYKQSMSGKGRGVMRDFDRAVAATLSLPDGLGDLLSATEAKRLRESQIEALYLRFLMYGFNASASRMLATYPAAPVRAGVKGWLGWVFSLTRLNFLLPSRLLVQGVTRLAQRRSWNRFLERSGMNDGLHAPETPAVSASISSVPR